MVKTAQEIGRQNARLYVERFIVLQSRDPEAAKEYALNELIKLGLFSKDGEPKDKIVSWD